MKQGPQPFWLGALLYAFYAPAPPSAAVASGTAS